MEDSALESINRYLAGTLSQADRDAVEARIVGDARFRREFELSYILRRGLADLEAAGQLQALVGSRPLWKRPVFAVAASVALVASLIGLLLATDIWRSRGDTATGPVQAPIVEQQADSGTRILRLAQMRGRADEPNLIWFAEPEIDRLELHIEAAEDPAARYELKIEKVGDGRAEIAEFPSLIPSDGELIATIGASLLPPGDYRLTVQQLDSRARTVVHLRVEPWD